MKKAPRKNGADFVEKVDSAREAEILIIFLPRVSRGKKHFYPHNCANCRHCRQ